MTNRIFKLALLGLSLVVTTLHYSNAETTATRQTTETTSFISFEGNHDLPYAFRQDLAPSERSNLIINHYAHQFGIAFPREELHLLTHDKDEKNNQTLRYRQHYQGIPILGAELRINFDANEQVSSLNGQTSPFPTITTTPKQSSTIAREQALTAFKKWYPESEENALTPSTPQLNIYDPRLFRNDLGTPRLVWTITVSRAYPYPVREFILIDAETAGVLLHFNQIHSALNRLTYTANQLTENDGLTLPGTLVCDESEPSCVSGDEDAKAAHEYAEDTYQFFFNHYGRDSYDGQGASMASVTHYGNNLQNAFWDSQRAIFGDGLSRVDDIVAHEHVHAFTEKTSNLYYYDQSGAINESLSDLWGEFIDLQNGSGNDANAVRWHIGEDAPVFSTMSTHIRNMNNPAQFNSPDRMTSPLYWTREEDNRGVHINSAINNKAAALMTDGGSFNSQTISALGINKVSHIYYEAQTKLLGETSTYPDLYMALQQACQNLITTNVTSTSDCQQVKNALDAVEMNVDPAPNLRPQAEICAPSETVNSIYQTGFEGTINDWESKTLSGTVDACKTSTDNPKTGSQSAFCPDTDSESDTVWEQKNAVLLPANALLHFNHTYIFEPTYDYGLLEYSTDNGTNWQSAHSLYDEGKQPDTTISGVNSYNGHSLGYVSTRYDLSSLANQTVKFRFRVVTDLFVGAYGWHIDDFNLYTCQAVAPPANDTTPDNFDFTSKTDVSISTLQESNIVTITGINTAANITIINGEYRINGGNYTSGSGTINDQDTLQVRHTSSSSYQQRIETSITVGTETKTFSSTTESAPVVVTPVTPATPPTEEPATPTSSTTQELTSSSSGGGHLKPSLISLLISLLIIVYMRRATTMTSKQ